MTTPTSRHKPHNRQNQTHDPPSFTPTTSLHIQLHVSSLPSPLTPLTRPPPPPPPMAAIPKSVTALSANWEFKQADKDRFLPVAQFPTNVHLDLLHHGLIADPFFAKQELDCQWVGEKDWIYRTTFRAQKPQKGERKVLVFEGLDTYAVVTVNGAEVLRTDNMFIEYRVDVGGALKDGENCLEILFKSAFLEGKKVQDAEKEHHWGCWNGDPSRLAVRKAQYHYGWDWGPTLLTCGPWRPVTLETYTTRISSLRITTVVSSSLSSANITAKTSLEGYNAESTSIHYKITSASGATVLESSAQSEGDDTVSALTLEKPELWYPHGYGAQPLYKFTATLKDENGVEIDSVTKTIGVRTVKVVERELKDQPGTSFFFEINGVSIFCGGSNWIPADNFIPRIGDERYREWLQLLKDGNQVMARVWAGGIYEQDAFYDTCDELGILVWQDFAFGCGNYPAHMESFRESIKKEATYNVHRLHTHACIVLWAGNNEDYQYAESIEPDHLGYDPKDMNPDNWLKSGFPARYLYEKLLPDVVAEHGAGVTYHPGSPWGGVDSRDQTVGDIHQWNVWHGSQEKYQNFDKLGGRFVSEFGMEAFPDIRTIDAYLPEGSGERYPQSSTIDFHNKADGHERRLALYLVENFRYTFSPLEQYVYATQLMQSECLSTAYRLWRRDWKGPGREYTAGALVWQINDCWPVTSWAIVDYYLRPKHAYFTIKRELAAVVAGIKRVRVETPRDPWTRVDIDVEERVQVWAGSFKTEAIEDVQLVVRSWDVVSGEKVYDKVVKEFTLEENRSVEVADMRLPGWNGKAEGERDVVVGVYLVKDGEVLARRISFAEPLKYVKLQTPKHLKTEVCGDIVKISAEVPVKGVALETTKEGVVFEDNLVDIVPGEVVEVVCKGLDGGEVSVRYLL
ncbi:uncharacterized protein H6S33_003429 [Morchella sextelata]|uniref:uncharacterized protein n=1 Tax=Morchella sextelata TaxID=1174677 RepID=UPI001D05A121|nr:uncharacterized protein H6S33_003429 [Morchella sextelata]KAH0606595.1 hypothetical protein H6S33_003429 [Morchella sextelata]